MPVRALLIGLCATMLVACGARQRRAESAPATHPPMAATSVTTTVVVVPHGTHYGQGPVVVVPRYEEGPPAPPDPEPIAPPREHVVRGEAAVRCGGNERIRVHNRHVVAEDGAPAIVATGNCVVEVSESIVRGSPAVIVEGNAQVSLVECRVFGDLISGGNAGIATRGTAHEEGQVLQARVRTRPG